MLQTSINVQFGKNYYPVTGNSYKELENINWENLHENLDIVRIRKEEYIFLSFDKIKNEVILKPKYSLL